MNQRTPSRARFSPARLTAYEVLRDVAERDAYANLALKKRIKDAQLTDQDAAFATELVSGTLRMSGRYDAIIESATGRHLSQIDPAVHTVLQLGAHQLLSLQTANHAALNEQVELAKHVAGHRTAGFVNGVLRTISRSSPELWIETISARAQTERQRLAIVHSHPEWIVNAIADTLEAEGLEHQLEAALIANNEAPRVQLAILDGNLPDHVETRTGVLNAVGVSPIGRELSAGNPADVIRDLRLAFVEAKVQDQGSQLAALALIRTGEIMQGEAWLDLCAGPGGKTAVLAAEARRSGATVRANEVAAHRADLVRESVHRFSNVVTVVSHDGRTQEAFDGRLFHRILVDAPCSGLGALRRRPEARWRKQSSDLESLTQLQTELLNAASEHLAPGGLVAYVTCSPHLSETRAIIDAHLARHPELIELDAQARVQEIVREPIDFGPNRGLAAQLWPHRDNTDAMFIALLQRPHINPVD